MNQAEKKPRKTVPSQQASPIGEAIRTTRLIWNMTQENFGRIVGLRGRYISAIERGLKMPSLETERRLRQLIESDPNQLKTVSLPIIDPLASRLNVWLSSKPQLFREELPFQPNGTLTFVLTTRGILEFQDLYVRERVQAELESKPDSHLFYCSPSRESWDRDSLPTLQCSRLATEGQIETVISDLGENVRRRVHQITLPGSHLFHPAVKTILYRFPASSSSTTRQTGKVEIETPSGTTFVRLKDEDIGDAFNWLNRMMKEADIDLKELVT